MTRSTVDELKLYTALARAAQARLDACRRSDWHAEAQFSEKVVQLASLLEDGAGAVLTGRQKYQKRMLVGFVISCEHQAQELIKAKITVRHLLHTCLIRAGQDDDCHEPEIAMPDIHNVVPGVRTLGTVVLKNGVYAYIHFYDDGVPRPALLLPEQHYCVAFYLGDKLLHETPWVDLQCANTPYRIGPGVILDTKDILHIGDRGWEIIENHGY